MINARWTINDTAVHVYPNGAFGSLIVRDGTLTYPLDVCRALVPKLHYQDIENTLDTEVHAFFVRTASHEWGMNPDIIYLMASLVRHRYDDFSVATRAAVSRRLRPWSVFVNQPSLIDALENAESGADGEIMYYNVLLRLCGGSRELMLTCN